MQEREHASRLQSDLGHELARANALERDTASQAVELKRAQGELARLRHRLEQASKEGESDMKEREREAQRREDELVELNARFDVLSSQVSACVRHSSHTQARTHTRTVLG